MKRIIILVLILSWISSTQGQNIDISKDWKFEFGDNANWAQLGYDDSNWKKMVELGFVEDLGYPDFKGFAWFRKKIVIPSTIRQNAEKLGYVTLFLGGIDDSDQGFFNGKMVGESGKLPPNEYVQGYYAFRAYRIDLREILWDKENIIAVRLYDDQGNGGFYKGPYLISIPQGNEIKLSEKYIKGYVPLENQLVYVNSLKVPSNLKDKSILNNGLVFKTSLPGTIKLFLNDVFVEESNHSKSHSFFIPNKLINWSGENEFTYYLEKDSPKDELMMAKFEFTEASFTDVLKIKPQVAISIKGNKLDVKLDVSNQSNIDFKGKLSVELVADSYKLENSQTQKVALAKGASNALNFSLIANFKGVYKVHYKLMDASGKTMVGKIAAGILE